MDKLYLASKLGIYYYRVVSVDKMSPSEKVKAKDTRMILLQWVSVKQNGKWIANGEGGRPQWESYKRWVTPEQLVKSYKEVGADLVSEGKVVIEYALANGG